MNSTATQALRLLLDIPAAAEALDVSERTLWDLVRRGVIPSVKVGRCRRIPLRDLEIFVESRRAD